jgi:hypothetical protein
MHRDRSGLSEALIHPVALDFPEARSGQDARISSKKGFAC